MTIEQAIEHAEEVAQEMRYEYQECLAVHDMEEAMDCRKCGEEHEQLAAWLRELQERRKEPEIIRCAECKHRFTHNCVANVWVSVFGYTVNDDFYCGLAERRTDGKTT